MQRSANKKSLQGVFIFNKRCQRDRRTKNSEGFVKLSGVGWYCRRERLRRKNDPRL